jgi:hypothetical protein
MKTIALTPTCTTARSTQTGSELLANRAVLFIQRIYSFFQTSTGGFSLGAFAPVGANQPKEVAIAKEGNIHHSFNTAFQLFIQRGVLL